LSWVLQVGRGDRATANAKLPGLPARGAWRGRSDFSGGPASRPAAKEGTADSERTWRRQPGDEGLVARGAAGQALGGARAAGHQGGERSAPGELRLAGASDEGVPSCGTSLLCCYCTSPVPGDMSFTASCACIGHTVRV
jgi:hypothetical protein